MLNPPGSDQNVLDRCDYSSLSPSMMLNPLSVPQNEALSPIEKPLTLKELYSVIEPSEINDVDGRDFIGFREPDQLAGVDNTGKVLVSDETVLCGKVNV
jgi:hypothetical protein